MTSLGPQFDQQVRAACEANASTASAALSQALEQDLTLQVGRFESLQVRPAAAELQGAALAFELQTDRGSALLILPDDGPHMPAWGRDPEQAKTRLEPLLAQLRVLLPADVVIQGGRVVHVPDVAALLADCGLAAGASCQQLVLAGGEQTTSLMLVWPAQSSNTRSAAPGGRSKTPRKTLEYKDLDEGIKMLPQYARSLLRIRVPVSVTLAASRQTLRRIVDLGPGSIIQFRKSCEETLTLEVGDQVIAEGEAVKVGDKFGLWITGITLPGERFHKVVAAAAKS